MKKIKYQFILLMAVAIASQSVNISQPERADRVKILEPTSGPSLSATGAPGRIIRYTNRNATQFTLVDSSVNGYGMISSSTRPLSVSSSGWVLGYRQWAGESGTAGQIGAAFSSNGLNWTTYTNLNPGFGTGRYPSALGTPEYPYVFWNEYTGPQGNSLYGGKPYYAYDEFGWDGGSWSSPQIIDALWNSNKDHWILSPDYSYDAVNDELNFNVVSNDWSRDNIWLFHSEAYFDGTIIFGSETMIIDETNDLISGDASSSYTSNGIIDVNNYGVGYVAVSAYFLNGDTGGSSFANHHTLIFKKTEDYGVTWSGGQGGSNYYYIPDETFEDMIANGNFDLLWEWVCLEDGHVLATQPFASYGFDIRVDTDGDPHFLVGLIASDSDGVWTSHTANSIYHFTIDKDYLVNPGAPQTSTGWNYSKVMDMSEMFKWDNQGGESYWKIVFPSLAISEENDDVMYAVISGPDPGESVTLEENGTPDDVCDDFLGYPQWNEEIFVVKSEDGGQTWWCPYNATNTIPDCFYDENDDLICTEEWMCPDGETLNRPDEITAHAGTGATDTRVNIIFQAQDWCSQKIRIYAGWVELDECCEEPCACEMLGDVNSDGAINVLDIVALVNYIVYGTPLLFEVCGDLNGDNVNNILDIIIIINLIIEG
ncbi:MAG: hypothetical protein HQ510_04315 [Candidatus Marinimicrobia bacterium]|nr:hypothetical protein [Candidatus Neomarinimicrobiota bacterium]